MSVRILQSDVSRYSDDVQSTSDSELDNLFRSSSDSDYPISAFSELSSADYDESMQWPSRRCIIYDCDVNYYDMSDDLEEFLEDF